VFFAEFEPLDTRLSDRIRALETQKLLLTERVADLRRTAPQQSARNWRERYLAEQEQLDREMRDAEELAVETARGAQLEIGELPRWDEVKGTWERSTEGLVELTSGLTESVARGERAGRVVVYLEGK